MRIVIKTLSIHIHLIDCTENLKLSMTKDKLKRTNHTSMQPRNEKCSNLYICVELSRRKREMMKCQYFALMMN